MDEQSFYLSKEELARYSRHIAMDGFGLEAQQKLKAARVLVVGAGGLGSPSLLYLAAAGVGTIGLVEFDRVDDSNLQRQVLYSVDDVGRSKSEAAKQRLLALNPHIRIEVHEVRLTSENALDIIGRYDVVADGTDNFATRYLVNDACVMLGKPNVYASIFRFEGQVSVFNYRDAEGNTGPNYRDLYPSPPPPGLVPNCAEAGVLGVLPGIIGSMQALEVIKIVTGVGEVLSGRFLVFDALTFEPRIFKIRKSPDNPLNGDHPVITQLIDYDEFCGIKKTERQIKEISATELAAWMEQGEDFQLIDVREKYEYEIVNLGGELFPLGEIETLTARIDRNRKVVVHCKSGGRSAEAIRRLEERFGYTNLYNLRAGIMGYIEEVRPELQRY
ncbi:MAG: molybdopterin-synthase adenylyltransferase MoeB [Cyclobacteriaceae bacterium]|nr:molybdopterin-synthase adenylyltransferase MoeB [Cyclobacteriaceae bacterium]